MKILIVLIFALINIGPNVCKAQNFWKPLNAPAGPSAICVDSNGFVYVATFSGIFRSRPGSDGWSQIDSTNPHQCSALATSMYGDLYAGTEFDGIFITHDQGRTWFHFDTTIGGHLLPKILTLTVDRNGDVYAGTAYQGYVLRSKDRGTVWKIIDSMNSPVTNIVSSPNGYLFLSTGRDSGIYRSANNGNSWAQVKQGLTYPNIYSLACDARGSLFAGTNDWPRNSPPFTLSGIIFRSDNNGESWEQIDSLNSTAKVLMLNHHNDLFVGLEDGEIAYSSDRGIHWKNCNAQRFETIESLCVDRTGYIYFSSSFDVYRSDSFILGGLNNYHEETAVFSSFQSFPNPATTSTTLHFTLPTPEFVSIKVFDASGREVGVVTNREYDPGEHEVTFDTRELPNGIYFYRMTAGGQSVAKSFLLAR